MAVRRDAFERVCGFDEDLAVGEDVDLCWRMQLAGYRFTIGEGSYPDVRRVGPMHC